MNQVYLSMLVMPSRSLKRKMMNIENKSLTTKSTLHLAPEREAHRAKLGTLAE